MAHVQDLTFERLQDLYSSSNSGNNKNDHHKPNTNSSGSDMAHELFAIKSTTGTPRAESDDEEIESLADTSTARTTETTKVNPSEFVG